MVSVFRCVIDFNDGGLLAPKDCVEEFKGVYQKI